MNLFATPHRVHTLVLGWLILLGFTCSQAQMLSYYDLKDDNPRSRSNPFHELNSPITSESYKRYQDQPFTGKVRDKWGNGTFLWQYAYKDGLLHGKFKESIHTGGKARRKGKARAGRLHGTLVQWNDQGHKVKKIRYRNGKRHGWAVSWHSNGKRASKAHMKAGEHHGKSITYNQAGQKLTKVIAKEGSILNQTTPGLSPKGDPTGEYHLAVTAEAWGNITLILTKEGRYIYSIPERDQGIYSKGTWTQSEGTVYLTSDPQAAQKPLTITESIREDTQWVSFRIREKGTQKPIPFAIFILEQNGVPVGGANSDENGKGKMFRDPKRPYDRISIRWMSTNNLTFEPKDLRSNHFDMLLNTTGGPIFKPMDRAPWKVGKKGIFSPRGTFLPLVTKPSKTE